MITIIIKLVIITTVKFLFCTNNVAYEIYVLITIMHLKNLHNI